MRGSIVSSLQQWRWHATAAAKDRDNETGLDYFLARYYSATQGRFTSPDEFSGGPHELYMIGSGESQQQALHYEKGDGVKANQRKAFSLYKRAAELGDAWAQCNLAVAYLEGSGIKQDLA